jgi:hypothetical protein
VLTPHTDDAENSEVDGGDELEAAGKQRTPFDPGHADGAILERWRSASSTDAT